MIPSLERACLSLLSQINSSTTLIIATHNSTAAQINRWLEAFKLTGQSQLITVSDDTALSMWVQDDVHIITNGNGSYTLLISQQAKPSTHVLMQLIADAAGMSVSTAENLPDGGNVLAGDDFIMIGGDDWGDSDTSPLPGCCAENTFVITSRLNVPCELKRPLPAIGDDWHEILYLGNKPDSCQPIFHIDIFLTLAGRDDNNRPRVLVADPVMAANLLNWPPLAHDLHKHFDDIAAQLENSGFSVMRNPLPLVYCDLPDKRQRQWYFSSSNNVIVQICDTSDNIVWLPTYGHGNWPQLALTDDANIKIWQNMGFDVRPVSHCQPLAENFGGLKCFTKTWPIVT